MENNTYVNIGIVTYNRLAYTKQAIDSIIRYTMYPHVITVVDNGSMDGTSEYLRLLQTQGIIKNLVLLKRNIGIAKASNIAWHAEQCAEYFLKYDNDIVIQKKNWLARMVYTIDTIPFAGVIAYNFEPVSYPLYTINGCSVRIKKGNVGGACCLIPRRTEQLLGYWCEDYGVYGEEDADYGARVARLGLLNMLMADEHIGVHLPAGRAAIIDDTSSLYHAKDGHEEIFERDYRMFKDKQRRRNMVQGGVFSRNVEQYKDYNVSLYCMPKKLSKGMSLRPVCVPAGRSEDISSYARVTECIQKNNFKDAIQHIRKILRKYPHDIPLHMQYAHILFAMNRGMEARKILLAYVIAHQERLLKIKQKYASPDVHEAMMALGDLYFKKGDVPAGRRMMKKALTVPCDTNVFVQNCQSVAAREKVYGNRLYRTCYQRGIALLDGVRKKTMKEKYQLASLYKRVGDTQTAERAFRKILKSSPTAEYSGGAYFHLGEIYRTMHKLDQARAMFQKCIDIMPEHVHAQRGLVRLGDRPRVGFLTISNHSSVCPYVRLRAPYAYLEDEGIICYEHFQALFEGPLDIRMLRSLDIIAVQRDVVGMVPYKHLMQLCGVNKPKVIFEVDDDLLAIPETNPQYGAMREIKKNMLEYLKCADMVTVTTDVLRKRYARFNDRIIVLPNCLDERIWSKSPRQKSLISGPIKILFSGTNTHGADIELVIEALDTILTEEKNGVELHCWGTIPQALKQHPQIRTKLFTDAYTTYAECLQKNHFDIALVPLEDTPFNRAKSAIKWLEYSACRIAGIYSAVGVYEQYVGDNVAGLLVDNTVGAWYRAIKQLIHDRTLRRAMADRAHDEVYKKYTLRRNIEKWMDVYIQLYFENRKNQQHNKSVINDAANDSPEVWYRSMVRRSDVIWDAKVYAWTKLGDIIRQEAGVRWRDYYRHAIDILLQNVQKNEIAYYRLASLYKVIGDMGKAKRYFLQVINNTVFDDRRAGAYFHLGEIAKADGSIDDANDFFERCVAIMPGHRKAHAYLGTLAV